MSQPPPPPPSYPTPYEPPRFTDYRSAPQIPDLLGPGRRASIVMFILGGLGIVCGTLFGTAMSRMPDATLLNAPGMKLPDTTGTPYTPIQIIHIYVIIGTVVILLVGSAYVISGWFVRRGSRVAAVIGIILATLTIGWVFLEGIYAFFAAGNVPAGVCMLCFLGVIVPVLVMLIRWLGQSFQAAKYLAAYRQQLALQQVQYLHQQQVHQQTQPPAGPDALPDYDVRPKID